MENYNTHLQYVTGYEIRYETLDGKEYIVVPSVMLVEGVHSGSRGPVYHSPVELQDNLESWNNRPVYIDHPQVDGVFVSGNTPDILEQAVGKIFNAHFEDGRLKAEVWVQKDKIQALSPETLEKIKQAQPLDVSVGIFTDEDSIEGNWNGEHYEAIARNYRPDHLALLPNARGACSWDDGCGIRVNNENGGSIMFDTKKFKELNKQGYSVHLITNEQGYQELLQKVQRKLDAMDNDRFSYFLEELYKDYLVYKVHDREGGVKLYRRSYSVEANGECLMADNAVEVKREVQYVTMQEGMTRTKPPKNETDNLNNNKNQKQMSNEKKPCCEAKVDALIANAETKFSAKDRDWLMALEETQIDKLGPAEKQTNEPQVNAEEVIGTFKDTLKELTDYTALMPEEMREKVTAGVAQYEEHRKTLIKSIMDNSEMAEEDLSGMKTDVLEKIQKSVGTNDYSGQGAGGDIQNNSADEDILLPPGVESK